MTIRERSLWLLFWLTLLVGSAFLAAHFLVLRPNFLFGMYCWQRLANFDGVHYFDISRGGYYFGLSQSFFPGWPLLMRLGYKVVGEKVILLGGLVNLIFLFFSLNIFQKMNPNDSNQSKRWGVLLLLFWPVSFFLISFYTEGLFLFLTLVAFYLYFKKKLTLASFVAGLAAGVRIVGIFVILSILGEEIIHKLLHEGIKSLFQPRFLVKISFYFLIGGLGLWLYMFFLYQNFSDPLMFVHNQSAFLAGRETHHLVLLPQVLYRYLKMFATTPISNPIFFVLILEVWSLFWGVVGLIYLSLRKFPLSLSFYGWSSLLLPTLTGTLLSLPRFVLVIWPIFLGLSFLPIKLRRLLLVVNILLLLFAWMRFYQGWWIA